MCFKYEFPVLYFSLCRLFVRLLLDGKANLVFITFGYLTYISLEYFAVMHVSLCYRKNKIDLKDMFNSRYLYNKQIAV